MSDEKLSSHLQDWNERERLAERLLPLTGALYRDRGVVTTVCGISLVHKSPIEIIGAHRYMRKLYDRELPLEATLEALETLAGMNPSPARVDVGKLVAAHWARGGTERLGLFVQRELEGLANGREALRESPQDVVLYGFGRIGRILTRILVEKTGAGNKFRLRAIVVRRQMDGDIEKRLSLLKRDSVHGPFHGTVDLLPEENALTINGNYVKILYSDGPDQVDYEAHGIRDAIIIDNTGRWRDREGLGLHLRSKGASKVILTAPGKGGVPNIVYGVNHHDIPKEERTLSAASCTTNAIVPVLAVMDDRYGIVGGHVETIHSYTNDQNLIDNFHKKSRRGRSAALNMVITETGAASAIAKALPQLAGKITGNAIRVPTPNVSLAILNLELREATTRDAINEAFRQVSMDSPLTHQIDITSSPDVVSTDLVGNRHAAVVDATATIVHDGRCTLYVWYDNEYGYSCQVMRLLQEVAGVIPPVYPAA